MISMVATINKSCFAGRRVLTYYSCHRGNAKPQTTPDMEVVYGTPRFPPPDPAFGSGAAGCGPWTNLGQVYPGRWWSAALGCVEVSGGQGNLSGLRGSDAAHRAVMPRLPHNLR